MGLAIRQLTSPSDFNAFLDLPARLYANDANYVEPLRSSVARQLADDSSFLDYGRFQPFLAVRDEVVVGRVVAAVNDRLNDKEGIGVGLFGYFECIDDVTVAQALLAAASDWLKGQGCTVLRGPIDLSTHINCLCLVDGFDSAPYLMMPYNPAYYPKLLEATGLIGLKDAYAYDFPLSTKMAASFERGYRRALSAGISFRSIRTKGEGFEADCRSLYQVFNQAFADNWSATPRSEEEFLVEARELRKIADPGIFPIAEHNGKMVGFWMGLPDFNIALRHARGRLNLLGILKLLWHRRKINRARVIALGVLPEYQNRRYAIGPALIHLGMKGGLAHDPPYNRAELSWVWEDNRRSNRLIEAAGGRLYKTFRIYQKDL